MLVVVFLIAATGTAVKLWPDAPRKTPEGLSAALNRAGVDLNVSASRYLATVSEVCDKDRAEFGSAAGHFVDAPDGERAMRAGISYVCPDRLEEWATAYKVWKSESEKFKTP